MHLMNLKRLTFDLELGQAQWNGEVLELTRQQLECLAQVAFELYEQQRKGEIYQPETHFVSADMLQQFGVLKQDSPEKSLQAAISRFRLRIAAQAPIMYELESKTSMRLALDPLVVQQVQYNLPDSVLRQKLHRYAEPEKNDPQDADPPGHRQLSIELLRAEALWEAGQHEAAQAILEDLQRQPNLLDGYRMLELLELLSRTQYALSTDLNSPASDTEELARNLLPDIRQRTLEASALLTLMQARNLLCSQQVGQALSLTQKIQTDAGLPLALQVRIKLLHGTLLQHPARQPQPDYVQARTLFQQALELAQSMHWWWAVQAALKNIGLTYYEQAQSGAVIMRVFNLRQSRQAFREAHHFATELGYGTFDPESYLALACITQELYTHDTQGDLFSEQHLSIQFCLERATELSHGLPDTPRKRTLLLELAQLNGHAPFPVSFPVDSASETGQGEEG